MSEELFLPPHSIEAEQSVLGSLLLQPDSWDRIAEILTERDFYRAEHQLIFRHIARLVESGGQVDVITVGASLEGTGKLERLGGLPYLGALVSETPSAANIAYYAKIVRDHRLARDFTLAARDIAEIAESQDDGAQKLEKATEILNRLVETEKTSTESLSEATAKALETLEARYMSSDKISGLKTGFSDFDDLTCGLQDGDLIILAGRPSMGKTAFAVNIGEHVAINQQLPVMMFSLEMSSAQLALRSIASQGGVSLQRLRSGCIQDDDWPRITHAGSKISEAPFFIDASPGITATQMRARCRKIKRQHGLRLVIIDYLQLMADDAGNNRNEELSAITRSLKLMAKELNCPVILLSQLNRQVEARPNKRPVMSDLRESGAIEQDADLVAMLYRDEVYNEDSPNRGAAELLIRKQRMGPLDTVHLAFSGELSRFGNFSGRWVEPPARRQQRGMDYKQVASGE